MSRRKVAPLLLAASVFLTGASGLLIGSMTPAHAITSVEELRDVNSSSWAYQALSDLVEKYDVIEGYPDHTFKGNHKATRYEMAAALNAVIKAVGRDLARLGAEKANKSDLATLARLQEEFRNELAALNAKEGALESRASAIEAKNADQDKRLDLLEKTQLHGDFSVGMLADWAGGGNSTLVGDNNRGIKDSISTLGRFRLGVKVPVVPGYDNSSIGEGDVIARLVGAFGRWTPAGANSTSAVNVEPLSGYSAIAGGASANNEGVQSSSLQLGTNTGVNLRQNFYIESAYFKQHFKPGIPLLSNLYIFPDNDKYRTTSDMYVGLVPWRNLFDRSPYRGDELNQFQNTALVNNAGLLVNNITPTWALALHQGLGDHFNADGTVALKTLDSADLMNGFTISEELAVNYDTWFLGQHYDKPGTVFVGGYHVLMDGNQSLATLAGPTTLLNRTGQVTFFKDKGNRDLNAFYAGWNQEWWRGIGTSVDYVLNSTDANNALLYSLNQGTGANVAYNSTGTARTIVGIQQSLSAELSVPMTVFNKDLTKRAKDLWGFGYSFLDPTNPSGTGTATVAFNRRYEHVLETFYRWAVNDSVSVIPSFQVLINRNGVRQNSADWILGLRTNYVF